nr:MAG TPA: hypothetical protein [Caudoviricetes sp.]
MGIHQYPINVVLSSSYSRPIFKKSPRNRAFFNSLCGRCVAKFLQKKEAPSGSALFSAIY